METIAKEISFWEGLWKEGKNHWQKSEVHPDLIQYLNLYTTEEVNYNKTILFPLCGQTIDMYYLFKEKQYNVIGIEAIDSCIQEFFQLYQLKPKIDILNEEKDDKLYQVQLGAGSLKILKVDLFDSLNYLELFNEINFVFDRGSLTAISPHQRELYVNIILKWLKKEGIILLNCPRYELKFQNGPPHSLPKETVLDLYQNSNCKVDLVRETEMEIKGNPAISQLFKIIKN